MVLKRETFTKEKDSSRKEKKSNEKHIRIWENVENDVEPPSWCTSHNKLPNVWLDKYKSIYFASTKHKWLTVVGEIQKYP